MSARRACVVGAGAWGTALAKVLTDAGHDVRIWSYEAEVADAINERHENPYLSGNHASGGAAGGRRPGAGPSRTPISSSP